MITLEDIQSGSSLGYFLSLAPVAAGAYEHFRDRAVNPVVIEDETIVHELADGMISAPRRSREARVGCK